MAKKLNLLFGMGFLIVCAFANLGHSADINTCYQTAEKILAELKSIAQKRGVPNNEYEYISSDLSEYQLYAKAVELFDKVQLMRNLSDASKRLPTPSIPIRVLTYDDVNGILLKTLEETTAARKEAGGAEPKAEQSSGKSAKELEVIMAKILTFIQDLGNPDHMPSNVYQNASNCQEIIKLILKQKGVTQAPAPITEEIKNKKSSDAFDAAQGVLNTIKAIIAKHPELKVSGALDRDKAKDTKPRHVYGAINLALGALLEILVKVGGSGTFNFVPFESGKTPSDVYRRNLENKNLLETLP